MFSNRTSWSLEKNPLTHLYEDLKSQNCDILDLTVSNSTKCHIEYLEKEILNPLLSKENILYQPVSSGLMSARKSVASIYKKSGTSVDPSCIVLTSSTSEAYSFLFRLLLNEGDHVLLPRPSYPLFEFLANLNDVKADFYSLTYDQEWKIDFKKLEALIGEKTRAIVLVNPNNPTGSFILPEELKEINRICKKHNICIICDEVFFDYDFQSSDCATNSLACNQDVLTFVLGGLSKALGLPQMKLSWILTSGPSNQVDEALGRLEIICDTYLSVSTPSQNALSGWLALKPDMQKRIKNRLKSNLVVFNKVLDERKDLFEMRNSQGGWYVIAKILKNVEEEKLAYDLLKEKHVFVHPGYFFDFEDEPYFIFSLLTSSEIFEEGLQRIISYLDAFSE